MTRHRLFQMSEVERIMYDKYGEWVTWNRRSCCLCQRFAHVYYRPMLGWLICRALFEKIRSVLPEWEDAQKLWTVWVLRQKKCIYLVLDLEPILCWLPAHAARTIKYRRRTIKEPIWRNQNCECQYCTRTRLPTREAQLSISVGAEKSRDGVARTTFRGTESTCRNPDAENIRNPREKNNSLGRDNIQQTAEMND